MKIAVFLHLISTLWLCVRFTLAFHTHTLLSQQRSLIRSRLFSNPDNEETTRPVLVKQSLFISAIDAVKKDKGIVEKDEDNVGYAIGRIKADLPIPPGIDLIETPELVLVNGVDQIAYDAGVQPLDTIVGVATSDRTYEESTLAMSFDETYKVIMLAIAHARETNDSTIELELNRLVKGYYK